MIFYKNNFLFAVRKLSPFWLIFFLLFLQACAVQNSGIIESVNNQGKNNIYHLLDGVIVETSDTLTVPFKSNFSLNREQLIWNKHLGAFQFGKNYLFEKENQDTLSGKYSFSGGRETFAFDYSFAFGDSVLIHGPRKVGFGKNITATFLGKGLENMIKWDPAFVVGNSCYSHSIRSTVFGHHSGIRYISSGAVAMGYKAVCGIPLELIRPVANINTSSATVSIGYKTLAQGNYALALGSYASNNNNSGSLVFGDYSIKQNIENTARNQFVARVVGGVQFYSGREEALVEVSNGGSSWNEFLGKNQKENLQIINYPKLLSAISNINTYTWKKKLGGTEVTKLGILPYEFNQSLLTNESKNQLNVGDVDGAIMAGIKGISLRFNQLETIFDLKELSTKTEIQKEQFSSIANRMKKLEEKFLN